MSELAKSYDADNDKYTNDDGTWTVDGVVYNDRKDAQSAIGIKEEFEDLTGFFVFLALVNHVVDPIHAMISVKKKRTRLKKGFKVSLTPVLKKGNTGINFSYNF